jgi:ATP-dependent helicase IRC3
VTLPLFDYQTEAIAAVRAKLREGVIRQAIGLPTGTGKTIVFGTMVASARKRSDWRTLILAHRDELIQQAVDKVLMIDPDLWADVGVVKAERNEWDKPIVVASVQSLHARRLEQLPRDLFQLGVIDEAHHAAADTYQAVIRHFGFHRDDPLPSAKLLLGVSATLERNDSRALADTFDEVVYSRSILEMIAGGRLCDLGGIAVRVEGLNLDDVKSSRGDWQDGDLGDAMEAAHAPEQAVEAWLEHAQGRKTIAFTPTVRLSERIAAAFADAGVAAEHLDGTTPLDRRRAMLERFASGETLVLSNCGVLTEGFDEPSVQCVLMARPTRSRGLYVQCVGRGTRLHQSKANVQTQPGEDVYRPGCLVLDLAGAATKHTLVSVPRLVAGQGIDEQVAAMMDAEGLSVVQGLERQNELARTGKLVARQIDLFRQRKVAWRQAAPDVWTLAGRIIVRQDADQTWRVIDKGARARDAQGERAAVAAQPARLLAERLTLEYAMGVGEQASRELDLGTLVAKNAGWRRQPASEPQRRALYRFGKRALSQRDDLTKGEAGDVLDVLVALAEDR